MSAVLAPPDPPSAPEPPPKPRGTRRLVIALVVVTAVLALLFAADRGVQTLVERGIGGEVQRAVDASQPASVDLGSFPFLHEIGIGRVHAADVRVAELKLPNGNGATATDVRGTFADITLSDGFTKVVAAEGRATGLVSYPSVSALTGLDVSYVAPDRVAIDFTVPIGLETVSGTATGRPILDSERQTLAFEDVEVTIPGSEGDEALLEAAGRLVFRAVPLGGLPYQLRFTELSVSDVGVRIGASGQNLSLRE